jgi:hypothetical protein
MLLLQLTDGSPQTLLRLALESQAQCADVIPINGGKIL